MTFDNDGAVDACQEARPHTIDGKMVSKKHMFNLWKKEVIFSNL